MNERMKSVAAFLEAEESFSELCERFGISRKQGYKWRDRYEAGGIDALQDRSRAPVHRPQTVGERVARLLVEARRRHPRWGPRKLLVVLKRSYPEVEFPVASTVGELLKRRGLVGQRRKRHRSAPYPDQLLGYDGPNSVWCADFKGHFPVAGERCNPLTIMDGCRYLLCCKALKSSLSCQFAAPCRHL